MFKKVLLVEVKYYKMDTWIHSNEPGHQKWWLCVYIKYSTFESHWDIYM